MNGELIALEYFMELKQKLFMTFSTPSGEPLMDVSYEKQHLAAMPTGWLFNKFTPGTI